MAKNVPLSPKQATEAIKERRKKNLQEVARGSGGAGNPNSIADPNNPLWKIEFLHIPTGMRITLPGWITSFSDNLASTWNEETVYGRMDPLVTFQRTQRTISTSFDVIASNKAMAVQNNKLVDYLLNLLYPVYNEAAFADSNTLKAAPLMKVKWANLINTDTLGDGLVGYIDGFTYQPDFNSGFFIEKGNMFPQLLRLNFNLKVIHTQFPNPRIGAPVRHGSSGENATWAPASAVNISELEAQKRQLLQIQAQEKLVMMNINEEFGAKRGPLWHKARKEARAGFRETDPEDLGPGGSGHDAHADLWEE